MAHSEGDTSLTWHAGPEILELWARIYRHASAGVAPPGSVVVYVANIGTHEPVHVAADQRQLEHFVAIAEQLVGLVGVGAPIPTAPC